MAPKKKPAATPKKMAKKKDNEDSSAEKAENKIDEEDAENLAEEKEEEKEANGSGESAEPLATQNTPKPNETKEKKQKKEKGTKGKKKTEKAGKKTPPMKRPAAKGEKDDEKDKKEKTESLKDKTEKWKQVGNKGTQQSDSCSAEEEEEDESSGAKQKRARGKAKKFKKMADSGAIPDHIWELFQKESAKHPKPRQFKTQLINKLFKDDGNGGYIMCAEDPWFQQQQEVFHKRYGKDEQQGTPRDVFLYQVFHGNSDALDTAIQNGSVQQWEQDGIPWCGFRKTKAGVENAKKDISKVGAKQVKLDGSQYQAISKAFKTLSWSFDQDGGGSGGGSLPSSGSKRKAVEDVGLTKEMATTLQDAKNAQEKLHATAMKLLNKCSSVDDKKDFKVTVMALKNLALKNDHVLTWKELPDEQALTPTNFGVFITDQAEGTQKLNEEVEKFKALLKTRGEL